MKRPKKTKVVHGSDVSQGTSTASTGMSAIEEASASTLVEQDSDSDDNSQDTHDEELPKEEKFTLTELRKHVREANVLVQKADRGGAQA